MRERPQARELEGPPCRVQGGEWERHEAKTSHLSSRYKGHCPCRRLPGGSHSPLGDGELQGFTGRARCLAGVTVALHPCPGLLWVSPPARPWCSCSPGGATRSTCAPSAWGGPAQGASPSRSTPQVCARATHSPGPTVAMLWQAQCCHDFTGK